ncbi:hypothetical protein SNE40_010850 [Patella caerulea]|uniref:Uncharacterized protein n=1 Tax=Patella caerulea TaxID=87958 RepID=A0AAN8JWS8_PATCE
MQEDSYRHWGYQRYERVMEYRTRPILPPPFIFFEHLYRIIVCIKSGDCKNKVGPEPEQDEHGEELTDEVNQSYSRAEKNKAKRCVDLLKRNPQLAQNNYNHLPSHQPINLSSVTTDKEDTGTALRSKKVEKSDVYNTEDYEVDDVDHSVSYEVAKDIKRTRRSPITNDTFQTTSTSGRVDIQQSLSEIATSIQHLEQKIESKHTLNGRDEQILDELKKIKAGQELSIRQSTTTTQEIQEDDDYHDYQNDDLPTYPKHRGKAKNKLLHSSLCFSNLAEYQRLRRLQVHRKFRDQTKSKKRTTKKTQTDGEDFANTL